MTQNHVRLIKVPLFQRAELPTDDVVTITVHLEDPPTSDSDLIPCCHMQWNCLQYFVHIRQRNYPNTACNYVSMNIEVTYISTNSAVRCGLPITYQHFPSTAKLTFYPVNKWGSFSILPSGGYTTGLVPSQNNWTSPRDSIWKPMVMMI